MTRRKPTASSRIRGLAASAAGWCALAAAPVFALHQGPPVWTELSIQEGEVVFTISGEEKALQPCLGIELAMVGPMESDGEEALRRAIVEFVRRAEPLTIDGRKVEPVLRELEIPVADAFSEGWVFTHARFAYPCEEPPQRISVQWSSYEGTEWMGEHFVPVTIKNGRKIEGMITLQPTEPEYIWHSPGRPEPPKAIESVVVEREPETFEVPVVSLVVLAGSLVAYGLLRRAGVRLVPARAGFAAGLLASALLSGVGRIELRSPLERVVAVPPEGQALDIFATLHGNVYDAFSARTEGEIYDLLAVSVDAAVLDDLYGDVYESLILREQGGAVCSIEGVDVLDRAVRFDETGEPAFRVDCRWQVHGVVSHWGHLHRRTNEYRAEYRVHHDGRAWKIADVVVKEHKRIDLPEDPENAGPEVDADEVREE